jgi:hypothetical protein
MKKIIYILSLAIFLMSHAWAAMTLSGTLIANVAFVNTATTNVATTIVTSIYGVSGNSGVFNINTVVSTDNYATYLFSNVGNITDNFSISLSSSHPSWNFSLIADSNQDGIHQAGENTVLSPVQNLASGAQRYFFIKATSPGTPVNGYVTLTVQGSINDGSSYLGDNATTYGLSDTKISTFNYFVSGSDSTPPVISNVVYSGQNIIDGDFIKPTGLLAAMVVDSESGVSVSSLRVIVDGVTYNSGISFVSGNLTFTIPTLADGTHAITVYALNNDGFAGQLSKINLQVSSEAVIIGRVLNYPNPFKSGTCTQIAYQLSKETDITFIVFDLIAEPIFKGTIKAGDPGARAGYNEFCWDGKNGQGKNIGNGFYLGVILDKNGRVMGKVKTLVAN